MKNGIRKKNVGHVVAVLFICTHLQAGLFLVSAIQGNSEYRIPLPSISQDEILDNATPPYGQPFRDLSIEPPRLWNN